LHKNYKEDAVSLRYFACHAYINRRLILLFFMFLFTHPAYWFFNVYIDIFNIPNQPAMPKEEVADLLRFLYEFSPEIREKAIWLREFVWDLYPQANELIYDNYNALAFGWSPTEKLGQTFCSVALYRSTNQNVHFGFYWGSEIADPKQLLLGNGNQYRYILVNKLDDFPKDYITALIEQAWENSLAKIKNPKDIVQGKTITKMMSPKKREMKAKK